MSNDVREIARDASEYPASLRDLRDAPARIWARGELPRGPSVAIVGTRRASPEALAFTERLARELAIGRVAVISGGAEGIDAAAHRGALLGGGATVVVQAAALESPYPRKHAALFARVLEGGGAWLSETPPKEGAERWRFLARNRLIAALADAVVVVQAPARSGALSTARFAQTLGRPLFAVPGAPWDPRADGTLALLASGARPCRSSSDLASLVGAPQVTLKLPTPPPAGVEASERDRVLHALREGPAHVDELVERVKLGAARVQIALVELSMEGRVQQSRGRWHAVGP